MRDAFQPRELAHRGRNRASHLSRAAVSLPTHLICPLMRPSDASDTMSDAMSNTMSDATIDTSTGTLSRARWLADPLLFVGTLAAGLGWMLLGMARPVEAISPASRGGPAAASSAMRAGALLETSFQDERADANGAAAATDEQIQTWVQQLNDERFATRESATRALMNAGGASLPAVAEAVQHDSAEVRVRALYVLEHLAASTDAQLQQQAVGVIEELARGELPQVSVAARQSLTRIDALRSANTLQRFIAQGAVVERSRMNVNGQSQEVIASLTIDPNWQGEAEDLLQLRWLEDIRSVELIGERITNEVVAAALQIDGLLTLSLKDAKIDPQAFASLGSNEAAAQLLTLTIKYCPVGDAAVPTIGEAKKLQLLELYGTEITREGLTQLAQLLPAAELDYRRGGFLGVRGISDPLGGLDDTQCRISEVVAGSAAEQAGLEPGDVVIEANGREIRGIEDLIEVARPLVPGDKIEITFLRNGESVDTTLILGRWE